MEEEAVPMASAAAWSPTAAPTPKFESKVLTLDEALMAGLRLGETAPAEPEPEPEAPAPQPAIDRLAALRDIARRLRTGAGRRGDAPVRHRHVVQVHRLRRRRC